MPREDFPRFLGNLQAHGGIVIGEHGHRVSGVPVHIQLIANARKTPGMTNDSVAIHQNFLKAKCVSIAASGLDLASDQVLGRLLCQQSVLSKRAIEAEKIGTRRKTAARRAALKYVQKIV